MEGASKQVDAVIFMFFVLKATFAPLFYAQFCLPKEYHPKFLVDLSSFYVNEYGDYFVEEKPNFYVGLAWMGLCVLWPLSIANIYGMVYRKSWFKTTCLSHGVCLTTMMVAIISEIIGSDKENDDLKRVYFLSMGLCILVTLRGLYSSLCETSTTTSTTTTTTNVGKKPLLETRKKKA